MIDKKIIVVKLCPTELNIIIVTIIIKLGLSYTKMLRSTYSLKGTKISMK